MVLVIMASNGVISNLAKKNSLSYCKNSIDTDISFSFKYNSAILLFFTLLGEIVLFKIICNFKILSDFLYFFTYLE